MIKLLVVAPYRNFADMFREVFAKQHADVDGTDHDVQLDLIVEYDQEKISRMQPSCDVVIARGFSATILKRGKIPVVEVPLLPYDIIRVLLKSRELHPGRRVVFPATPNLTAHAESLDTLLGLDIEFIHMPSTMGREPEIAFGKIRDPDGCVVIGGKPITDFAERLGMPNFTIESGPEAMASALAEATRLARVRRLEQERAQSFKSILDYNTDGILALDKENRFTTLNAMAGKILELNGAAVGRTLASFHPDTPLTTLLARVPHCSDEIVLFKNTPLVVNKTGIFLEGERIGSVVTLQYLTKIQNSEKNIRNKIADRGLVAKHSFDDIRGDGPAIRQAVRTAHRFAGVDSGVLIIGQSGTGKELFAQSIHSESQQKRHPFMAINCAAIPENLLESELFGYAEGAFTGAVKGGKPGLIELAHMGTLFLDEIGEMPLRLQARLLRVLQEKEFMRIGGEKVTPVTIRVIAATNKNLPDLIDAGQFREDLYYRLAVLTLRLPPLSERVEDIPLLVSLFLEESARRLQRPLFAVSAETMAMLCRLPWPGNVRELRNICEQLIVLCDDATIDKEQTEAVLAEKLQRTHAADKHFAQTPTKARHPECTPETVRALLSEGLSKQKVADTLGINRSTLWRRMREWELC